ncbi:MAG: hypothetical protein P1U63_01400 [Coxiellaceae bacterium]|nr:hypothetical protein [Coxiellaceae bacterium]
MAKEKPRMTLDVMRDIFAKATASRQRLHEIKKDTSLGELAQNLHAFVESEPSIQPSANAVEKKATINKKVKDLIDTSGLTKADKAALLKKVDEISDLPTSKDGCSEEQKKLFDTTQQFKDIYKAIDPDDRPGIEGKVKNRVAAAAKHIKSGQRYVDQHKMDNGRLQNEPGKSITSSFPTEEDAMGACASMLKTPYPGPQADRSLDTSLTSEFPAGLLSKDAFAVASPDASDQEQKEIKEKRNTAWETVQGKPGVSPHYSANREAYADKLLSTTFDAHLAIESIADKGDFKPDGDPQEIALDVVGSDDSGMRTPPPHPNTKDILKHLPKGDTIGNKVTLKVANDLVDADKAVRSAQENLQSVMKKHRALTQSIKTPDAPETHKAEVEMRQALDRLKSAQKKHTAACDTFIKEGKLDDPRSAHRFALLLKGAPLKGLDEASSNALRCKVLNSLNRGASPEQAQQLREGMGQSKTHGSKVTSGYRVITAKDGVGGWMYRSICKSDPILGLAIYGVCRLLSYAKGKPVGIFSAIKETQMTQKSAMKLLADFKNTEAGIDLDKLPGVTLGANTLHRKFYFDEDKVKENRTAFEDWAKNQPEGQRSETSYVDAMAKEGKAVAHPYTLDEAKDIVKKAHKAFHTYCKDGLAKLKKAELKKFNGEDEKGLEGEQHKDPESGGDKDQRTAVSADGPGSADGQSARVPVSGAANGTGGRPEEDQPTAGDRQPNLAAGSHATVPVAAR